MKTYWKAQRERMAERLTAIWNGRLGLTAGWTGRHAADCPRCRRRLAGLARARLAMTLLKSQSHSLDLLARANGAATAVLQRDLRQSETAQALRHVLPHPALLQRMGRYTFAVTRAAACLLVVAGIRLGVFRGMEQIRSEGSRAMRQYYANHLDSDLLEEFSDSWDERV